MQPVTAGAEGRSVDKMSQQASDHCVVISALLLSDLSLARAAAKRKIRVVELWRQTLAPFHSLSNRFLFSSPFPHVTWLVKQKWQNCLWIRSQEMTRHYFRVLEFSLLSLGWAHWALGYVKCFFLWLQLVCIRSMSPSLLKDGSTGISSYLCFTEQL